MTRGRIGWALVALQGVLLIGLVVVPRRPPTLLSCAIGVPLIAAGIVLGLMAGRSLGVALTPTPVPIAGAGLRTDGPYRLVRHPIYSAILLAAGGFVVLMGSGWTLLVLALLCAFFLAKSRWEDSLLRDQYGQAWIAWAARTGALIPRVR